MGHAPASTHEGHMPRIHLTTVIRVPPELCFDLVLNVDTQVALVGGMRAIAGVRAGPLHQDDTVTWRSWHFGIPWHMTSKVMVIERPQRFVDEMQHGPFASWRHVHEFQPISEGTAMHDTVYYATPLGILGRVFDVAVLRHYLMALLRDRNKRLKRLAERTAGD